MPDPAAESAASVKPTAVRRFGPLGCFTLSVVALVLLVAALFRRRHGRLPTELNELVPELLEIVPLDRYDGLPLRYVVREDECLIYSVGENGLDDGGDIDFPPEWGQPLDRGFRLAIPAAGE